MERFVPTIGLEVHAELKTATKMFCNSRNVTHEVPPNSNICPVCLAHPGTLPVINREAVRHVLRMGLAVGGTLADYTEFDRKNYFYPDLPKGYQISQYEYPLVSGGSLAGVALTRIHLEEDTASSTHDASGGTQVDFNRAGVPLMELVTEPVIHDVATAVAFGQELRLLLRYLGASDADMEKGHMRLEANISLSDSDRLGTKVEVKNINSFRAMERAILYEIQRQSETLSRGEDIMQETRGWDDAKQVTFSQRLKEGSADYRYFPDPDLPSLRLSELPEFSRDVLKGTLPELPSERRARYTNLGLKEADAVQFTSYPLLGDFIDEILARNQSPSFAQKAANYLANDLASVIRDMQGPDTEKEAKMPISSQYFSELIALVEGGKLTSRAAKDVLMAVIKDNKSPATIAEEQGLFSGGAVDVTVLVEEVLRANPSVVADYTSGKGAALQYLVGQCMKLSKGTIEPDMIKNTLIRGIESAR